MKYQLSPLWLKASVIGSIWAAFEIIIGSFLHNLHIPFSGTFLASASVFLLINFMQLWKEKGIIIRAGIICALMKSISPSAIILGPMVGIFLEALLIEFSTRVFGRNIFGYVIGGALAVCSTLFQKIANYLIVYGFDIVSIVKAFYEFLIRQTNLPRIAPASLIVSVFVFYAVLGMLAASWGYFSGKKHLFDLTQKESKSIISPEKIKNTPVGKNLSGHSPYFALLLIFSGMIFSLFMINSNYTLASLIFGIIYISFAYVNYKEAFKKLNKPALWFQFAFFTIIAAVSWEWIRTESFYSTEGLIVALKMNFRAIIVILGFAAISVELRSPVIKLLLTRNGFSPVYNALSLSFAALPAVVSTFPGKKVLHKESKNLLSNLFFQAQNLLKQFEINNLQTNHIYIVTGAIHQGKTGFARQLANLFKNRGYQVDGFISPGTFKDNERYSFEIESLKNGKTYLLCSREEQMGWEKFGPFYFDPEVIDIGNNILKSSGENSIVFVDELGKFEFLEKKGWYKGISGLASNHKSIQIWVVRDNYLPLLLKNFEIPEKNIFDINKTNPNELYKKIISTLKFENELINVP